MEPLLTPEELRVLGCLIEKGITTPDYYPMTLNALTAACNQKSNRAPVVQYNEKTVVRTLDSLRDKELVRVVSGHDARVPKYYHRFNDVRGFTGPEVAVLCELMLRGPQTPGELRSRGSRMHPFENRAEVEAVLESLMNREAGAAVVRLPRQAGFKESRLRPSARGPSRNRGAFRRRLGRSRRAGKGQAGSRPACRRLRGRKARPPRSRSRLPALGIRGVQASVRIGCLPEACIRSRGSPAVPV